MTQTSQQMRTAGPGTAEAAVEYRNVTFRYPRGAPGGGAGASVLEDVTLSIVPGERLGILGPNGGGKSTLLKLTLGLLQGFSGSIRVLGMTPEQARRTRLIGYVPQRVEAELAFPLTVRQVVGLAASVGLRPWESLTPEARGHVDECLRVVGVKELSERAIGRLSGGQLQRVMIARALACSPKILMLDEPMVGIDAVGQKQFAELLERLNAQLGLTIMVVSHDIRTVAAGCDRVACLSRTLHSHMAPGGLTPAVLAEVFRHDVAAIFGGDVHVHAHSAESCPIEHGVRASENPSPARRASPPLPGDRGEGGGGR